MENEIYYGYCCQLNEYGKPIERTPMTHPYSYEGFVTYRNGKNSEANCTIYSDRLLRQDYEKARLLMKKHFGESGDYYSNREPQKIEDFLSEFLNKKVKIIFIMEYCNQSDGYPYWRFDVKIEK